MTGPTTIDADAALAGFHKPAFDEFIESRAEPDWLTRARCAAFENYQELSDSPLDPEEWRRIELRAFRPEKFRIAAKAEVASDDTAAFPQHETLMHDRASFVGSVVHVDGTCRSTVLSDELSKKGVLFGDLATLIKDHREVLEPHLMQRAVRADKDRFSAWHAAFWTGGTVLYVPRGVVITEPLYSLIALAKDGVADLSHTLIVLEEGASATLLEETASADPQAAGLHVGAVELLVGPEAHLRYVQIQNWNEKTWHFAHQAGRVDRDGSLQWTVGGLGAKLAHIHQDVDLDAPGAEAEVNGVTFATSRQLISYYTQQTHNAPNTRSDLLYKDVLRDRSRVIWRGMIKVDPDAQRTDGYQRSDALLLSDTSRVDAIPGLEIEADDVRCTHGATAGRVDEEQLFYGMCRGLSEHEAMHMIVGGFLQVVSDRIPIPLVRETLSHAVEKKLGIGD